MSTMYTAEDTRQSVVQNDNKKLFSQLQDHIHKMIIPGMSGIVRSIDVYLARNVDNKTKNFKCSVIAHNVFIGYPGSQHSVDWAQYSLCEFGKITSLQFAGLQINS